MRSFQSTCIEELSEHCLYPEPNNNGSRSIFTDEEFAVVMVPLDNVDRSKVDECISSYNMFKQCKNCSRNCGDALKAGILVKIKIHKRVDLCIYDQEKIVSIMLLV